MDIQSIITRKEYEGIKDVSYDQFCGFIMKVVKLSVEESLKALPHVMTHLSKQIDYLKKLSIKFYTDNKDLVNHKPFVAKIIEQVEAENPGKAYEKVLEIAAEKAREALAKIPKDVSFESSKNDFIKTIDSKLKDL